MMLNERGLDAGLTRVEQGRAWSARLVARLEGLIRGVDDAALYRVNPMRFAAEHGVQPDEAVDLFVHATAAGLFCTDWLLICPNCACAVLNLARLGPIEPTYHCPICHQDTAAVLDEFIAVYFTVAPQIREIAHHQPNFLRAREYLIAGRGVREGRLPDGSVYLDFVGRALRAAAYLEPEDVTELELDAEPGLLQGFSVDGDAGFSLAVEAPASAAAAAEQRLEIRYFGDRAEPQVQTVPPGRLTLAIRNMTADRHVFAVMQLPPGFTDPHLTFDPFLTGQRLLMTQSFRDLFRADAAGHAEGIAIRNLALVFTDLQGSTALYQRVGDLNALEIVQHHFEVLREIVTRHGGCIVKTIGDAVMAAFPTSREAVAAGLAMVEAPVASAGAELPLVLKIGIHQGAAVAVTLNNQLDYFGQTVNLAARVQGLASAGELVLSDAVLHAGGVDRVIGRHTVEQRSMLVRGHAQPITVHHVRAT